MKVNFKRLLAAGIVVAMLMTASVLLNIHLYQELTATEKAARFIITKYSEVSISNWETEFDNKLLQERVKALEEQLEGAKK